jgi:hypothetical protein
MVAPPLSLDLQTLQQPTEVHKIVSKQTPKVCGADNVFVSGLICGSTKFRFGIQKITNFN